MTALRFRDLTELHPRKPDNFRGYAYWYAKAQREQMQEFFCTTVVMRKGYGDLHKPLYGPCRRMTNYIQWKKLSRSMDYLSMRGR